MKKFVKRYPLSMRRSGVNLGRMVFGLIIIPAALGFSGVLLSCVKNFSISYIPFIFGITVYTLVYPVFKKPLLSYVLGHELSHVIGVWLCRGRVYGMKVGRNGGMVKTDKANVLISLLPYFFPIYTMLVLGLYFIFSILWDLSRFFNFMVFLLGITWAFHLWMTLYIVRNNQPDIKESGVFFSSVVIFTINVIILTLLLVLISPELTTKEFLHQSFEKVEGCYLWILRHLS
jgi:hypothetical protein